MVLVLALLIQMISASLNASTDHLALLAIKSKITDDPQGVFKSWNDSLPFCQWQGVTCGSRHQRVTILNLTDKGLVGSISPYLGNLSFIRYIIFDENQIHGTIPPEIGRLSRLQALSFIKNSLTGEIPPNISSCSKLYFVNLANNMLYGKIHIFSSLSMLKTLVLGKNNFTGVIPPSIGNLTSLERLYLSGCASGGSIPDSFNRLKNLRELGLAFNGLVGAFPTFLLNHSMLEYLNFPSNQFHGSLPSNLCLIQPLLRVLELANNRFNGFLPPSISNCSKLESLDVSNNYFNGKIGIDFGRLPNLWSLILALNDLGSKDLDGMNFFYSLSNCSNLELLEFSSIQLGGVLPNSLGNFSSKLEYLGLEATYIAGHVPSSIGNLFRLTTLNLRSNYFTGTIPESIGKLQDLGNLYLGYNEFSGTIPRSIGNLSFVTKLELCENSLEGTIPSTFGVSKWLIFLDLHGNSLSGSVPKQLFQLYSLSIGLDLSRNNLSGVLPQEIGNLKLLGSLDFSENRFSGELPSGLGSCISLQNLNLSSNLLYGSLSQAFTPLKGLEYVDLSRNNFSGHIPTYLQQFLLTYLDLSYNNFEGDVPVKGVFSNTSAIVVVGNTRLCEGIPELHLPKCKSTTSDSERHTRKLSVGVVVAISLCSVVAGLSLLSFVLFYCCIKIKRDKPSESRLAESFEKISYGRLFKATEGFSSENLIGTDLVQRISIIKDVAYALDYLHCRCGNVIVHCDLKPSNILLDADMVAHVGDFGLAKILSLEEGSNAKESSSSIIRGTIGYTPPEYGLGNEVSTSGDIYSYGILLLEILTGKKPVDPMFEGGLGLHSYAKRALNDGFVLQIVDPMLLNEDVDEKSLISLVKIGVQCSCESPQDRMHIGTVVHELFATTVATKSAFVKHPQCNHSKSRQVQDLKNLSDAFLGEWVKYTGNATDSNNDLSLHQLLLSEEITGSLRKLKEREVRPRMNGCLQLSEKEHASQSDGTAAGTLFLAIGSVF
ncbi:hypothetical protein L1987_35802 [Smallanthus sonchifolius]|uniref:Uncharacterized protein n=1 Tax=Smallanthus sonchifolius TaxID=185202 RepID=A0ACB9HC98_9ASTR|nr:hypothetical protein L1987_35802 [Smallanthus sonchifolius]